MQTKTGLHDQLVHAKKAYTHRLSDENSDPFALLQAFVLGTRDLFDDALLNRLHDICARRCIKSYIELASEIDSYSKIYVTETPELVKGHRVLCSFLKKYPFTTSESPYTPRDAAIDKWHAAERKCKETNERLSQQTNGTLPRFVFHARRLIADALGDLTPSSIMKMLSDGEHGKGTTTECPFVASTVYHKYQQTTLYSTRRAKHYAKAAISLNRRWYDYLDGAGVRKNIPLPNSSQAYVEIQLLDDVIDLNEPERISFVNKDAKTMRPIGVGNTLNMYMQLGVKRFLMDKLKSVGVDLTDQTKNQRMALMGSLVGMADRDSQREQYSTIDLASASDTVSLGLCELLLPPEWFGFLSDLRHESGQLDGETIVYSKMSAMGNGYTFPLESLLFWAIARATAEVMDRPLSTDDLAVYGDDIICPLWLATHLVENLEWSGFMVNTEKSFLSGPFKESCGADYYQGINVRPLYLKRRLTTAKDIYHAANATLPRSLDKSCRVSSGYRSLYRYLQATLTKLGPILYRPLTDVFGHDKDGNSVYKDSDLGLAVPASLYRERGLGYLSTRSKVELFNRKWFKRSSKRWHNAELTALIRCTNLYALCVTDRLPREPRVDEYLRYSVCLESSCKQRADRDTYDSFNQRYGVDGRGGTTIVRKGKPSTTFRLLPVPNWDGFASKGLRTRHPAW